MIRFATMLCAALAACASARGERIVYEPLSADAAALGRLAKYRDAPRSNVHIELGGLRLQARVPERCDAYDAVPIEYALDGDAGPDARVAIEAVAFEDASRRAGRDLYDLALPGNLKIRIEYLGSRTGVFDPSRVTRLSATSRHTTFPPYVLEPFVRSGTVKRGNYLFFRFRVTNVGDTILDAEGFGGWMAMPQAHAVGADGALTLRAQTINLFERHLRYVYPGESFEQWISFHGGGDAAHWRTLPPGRYAIQYHAAYRWNTEWNWITNLWGGRPWQGLEVRLEVADAAADTPVTTKELRHESPDADRMTRYVASLEEFMTSFRVFEKDALHSPQTGTIHVQVAPWTKHLVLKLIGNTPGRIRTAAVPIAVSGENLAIRRNPDNPFVVKRDGRSEPAFCTQMMPAMRSTTQLGPHPEVHLRERLDEARRAGVNVICTTSGDWHVPEIFTPNAFVGDIQAETFKHYYDVIAPEAEMPVFGWGVYPPRTVAAKHVGEQYWGRAFDVPVLTTPPRFNYSSRPEVDVAHPDFPKLHAGTILYMHKHWGPLWYKTADGDVPIDVEDTWGWLRDDIHVRYYLGECAIRQFREWLAARYATIDAVNRAWGTAYARFDEIDPQKNQPDAGVAFGTPLHHVRPEYRDVKNPFCDWSAAVNDWDVFRTELRCDVYEQILGHVRKEIPRAQIVLRTEGAILPVRVPKESASAHLRHVYYAQRRNALIAEVLQRRKVFKYHSDYTTLPYTESEWRRLLIELREEGIRGIYLPQFCTARDMVLNDTYGRDFQTHYNLPAPKKAVMMHVLAAAFPVWRIQYEEGHLPGVLWEDFNCDGFVTETQLRELRVLREQFDRMGA